MASPLYNNANLYPKRKVEDEPLAYGQGDLAHPNPMTLDAKDPLLSDAKAALKRAALLSQEVPTSAIANIPSRLESLNQGREDVKQPLRDISALGWVNPALVPLMIPGIMDPAEGETSLGNATEAALASLPIEAAIGGAKAVWRGGKTAGKTGVQALREALTPVREGAFKFSHLSPAGQARNVEATNLVDQGFSHTMGGRLAEIPGAGESRNLTRQGPKGIQAKTGVQRALNQVHPGPDIPVRGRRSVKSPGDLPLSGDRMALAPATPIWEKQASERALREATRGETNAMSLASPAENFGLDEGSMAGDRLLNQGDSRLDAIYPPDEQGLAGVLSGKIPRDKMPPRAPASLTPEEKLGARAFDRFKKKYYKE